MKNDDYGKGIKINKKVKVLENDEITQIAKKEIGEQLQKIKEYEKKFKEKKEIEGNADFYFQIVFKSKSEKKAFLEKYKIKLIDNDYIFIENIISKFKEV
jgi:hypothetical protein